MSFSGRNRSLLGASIAALSFAFPFGAQAQTVEEEEEARQDVVVVTALKRETVLEDTPLALSVLDGEALDVAGVESIVDLQNVAPSVQIGRSDFGVTINVRGVTTTDQTSKGDQGIAFNVDGVTIGRPREMGTAFFDVARIEVLRGPQGTLYGKSTTGGVINVVTNRPSQEFGGSVDLEYGDYDTKRVEGAINIPVTDQFAVRGAVAYNERDGYLETA
ncbi:MAG: TonB-dependent receptor plug domain-containing protein, partial [Pseudomonadota bacterium]